MACRGVVAGWSLVGCGGTWNPLGAPFYSPGPSQSWVGSAQRAAHAMTGHKLSDELLEARPILPLPLTPALAATGLL
jgi:hypothetical protein